MAQRDSTAGGQNQRLTAFDEPDPSERSRPTSACGACGRLVAKEAGTEYFCPHALCSRRTRELTDEQLEELEAGEVADPAGRER